MRGKVVRRALDGVLLLDKPLGLSSNDALTRAKRMLRAQKAGHTGTLDPLATGLLPLCFGEATKFSQDLLEADKCYEARLQLGHTTLTGDAEGAILSSRPVTATRGDVDAVLASFVGVIEQVPPMYSALKRDGKPLYEYARAGVVLERPARQVSIHHIVLLSCDLEGAATIDVSVSCSKGTYIRTLAEDIGEALGCGAHLAALRRTAVGHLRVDEAVTLETLARSCEEVADEPLAMNVELLRPVDSLLTSLPALELDTDQARRFLQGQRLRLSAAAWPTDSRTAGHLADRSNVDAGADKDASDVSVGTQVRVYRQDRTFLGTAKLSDGLLMPGRLTVTSERRY